MNETIKRKLLSRKFWIAAASMVAAMIELWHPNGDSINGTILMIVSTIAYVFGEAIVDSNNIGKGE